MATSGTATFALNRNQLIESALRKISVIEEGETPASEMMNDASDALNAMIKHWQGSGVQIYKVAEAILFLQPNQTRYGLGLTATDHATESWVETELTVSAAGGAGTITVASVTGIATTYHIGIELDGGTMQWTTVNGAPAGLVVTLTAALTGAATSGNRVVCYQTKLIRPLRIISARSHDLDSLIDTPIDEMDRIEYREMPNKTATGSVNGFFYDRQTSATGYIHLWPAPSSIVEAVKMTVAKPIEDFTAAGDDADLPQEWIRAIVWGLADEIADEYDVPEPKRTRIEQRAARYLDEANWWERELLSIQFVPDR